jgi:hypothetical protein
LRSLVKFVDDILTFEHPSSIVIAGTPIYEYTSSDPKEHDVIFNYPIFVCMSGDDVSIFLYFVFIGLMNLHNSIIIFISYYSF